MGGEAADTTTFDALLVVSFGGPEGVDEVVPFLRRVTAGRGIPDARLEQVGAHYFHFDGVSPINAQNRLLTTALGSRLDVPVYLANLYSEPFIPDVVAQMAADGVASAAFWVTSMYSSGPGCRRYREAVAQAASATQGSPTFTRLRHAYGADGFVTPFVDGVVDALDSLDGDDVRLVFTTHSIPRATADVSGPPGAYPDDGGAYVAQHRLVASLVADAVAQRTGRTFTWDLVYQSRSGPPSVPWLEPDISEHLTALKSADADAAIIVPIGFVSDHMEVVWDLDTEALTHAASIGLPVVRVSTPGTDPRFVDLIVSLLRERETGSSDAQELPWNTCSPECCVPSQGVSERSHQ